MLSLASIYRYRSIPSISQTHHHTSNAQLHVSTITSIHMTEVIVVSVVVVVVVVLSVVLGAVVVVVMYV